MRRRATPSAKTSAMVQTCFAFAMRRRARICINADYTPLFQLSPLQFPRRGTVAIAQQSCSSKAEHATASPLAAHFEIVNARVAKRKLAFDGIKLSSSNHLKINTCLLGCRLHACDKLDYKLFARRSSSIYLYFTAQNSLPNTTRL